MQILEHTPTVLSLRNRPIRNWIGAAILLPLYSFSVGVFIYALLVSIASTDPEPKTILLLGFAVAGYCFFCTDTWLHAQVTRCRFDKDRRLVSLTYPAIWPRTVELRLDELQSVDIETIEGMPRPGVIVSTSRPYLKARSGHVFPLSANYIGFHHSTEVVRLIREFLDQN